MEIISQTIEIIPRVKLATDRSDNLKAFGELLILINNQKEAIFKVKGYTIRLKEFNGKDVLDVSAPAYRAGAFFVTSFVFTDKEMWAKIKKRFLEEYENESGEINIPDDF